MGSIVKRNRGTYQSTFGKGELWFSFLYFWGGKMMKWCFVDGTLCHIDFNGNVGSEINSVHLGVLYNIPGVDNLAFCIPLTSPKPKHFKTPDDFASRNYMETKHFSWQYLKQTDSIALLEQVKTISKDRIKHYYENQDGKIIVLNSDTQLLLKEKLITYLKRIVYKNKK